VKKKEEGRGPGAGPSMHGPTWPFGHAALHDRPGVVVLSRPGTLGKNIERTGAAGSSPGGDGDRRARWWRSSGGLRRSSNALGAFLTPGSGCSWVFRPRSTLGASSAGATSGRPGQRGEAGEDEKNMENKMGQRGREKGVRGELHWSTVFTVITPVRSAPASSSQRRPSALSERVLGWDRKC
jgi:hypothetical protein